MTDRSEAPAPFDGDVLSATAADYGVDERSLAEVVAGHQEAVEDLPGVENLVYEWRKAYETTVVERTEAAYYLVVPEWVWDEFGESLELGDVPLDAVVEVHRRTVAARTDATVDPPDGQTYVALERGLSGT